MIRILDGVPGSGKSYHAVEDMVERLRQGAHVVTNLPILWDQIKAHCAKPTPGFFSARPGVILEESQMTLLTEEQTKDFWTYLHQGTLDCPVEGYFDELQNLFNSRNWAETQRNHGDVLKFVSHHRHYHVNLTLLTQDRANIDKQFRRMCGEYWEHLDLNAWSLLGIRWPFPQFLRKKYGTDEKTRLKAWFKWKDRRIWGLYDSHNKVEGISLAKQVTRLKLVVARPSTLQTVRIMLKSWVIIGVVVIGLGVFVWGKVKPTPSKEKAVPSLSSRPVDVVGGVVAGSGSGSVPSRSPSPPSDSIVTEKLRYAEGNYHRRTDKGSYTIGRLCPWGRVERVEDDLVTVRRLDGTHVYVVLDGASSDAHALAVSSQQALAGVPLATPLPSPYVAWSPSGTSAFTAAESARISANVKASISGGRVQQPDQTYSSSSALPRPKGPTASVPMPANAKRGVVMVPGVPMVGLGPLAQPGTIPGH